PRPPRGPPGRGERHAGDGSGRQATGIDRSAPGGGDAPAEGLEAGAACRRIHDERRDAPGCAAPSRPGAAEGGEGLSDGVGARDRRGSGRTAGWDRARSRGQARTGKGPRSRARWATVAGERRVEEVERATAGRPAPAARPGCGEAGWAATPWPWRGE